MTSHEFDSAASTGTEPTSLAIFSATDRSLPERGTSDAAAMARAVRFLTLRQVPLVWISRRPAAAVLRLQSEFAFRHPFVCDAGACLYIPRGYFGEAGVLGSAVGDWHVIEFTVSQEVGPAARLLASLYRSSSPGLIIVGLAQDAADAALLQQVDVAVVVRSADGDATALLRSFPSAYVTHAVDTDGWREAVLGQDNQ
jgi:predicted mannosyl-3-phosphoglycerate phosphatase (HAD superfamily)